MEQQPRQLYVGRRAMMKGLATLAAGTAAPPMLPAAAKPVTQRVIVSQSNGVVEIKAGKVRGYTRNGIYVYKGIPYAAPATGAARFMPPQEPAPWTGVRNCLQYGPICATGPGRSAGDNASRNNEDQFLLYRANGYPGAGEDCLRLNIWTPEINSSKKRPVLVWYHGGGWSGGSGNDLLSYDGDNQARNNDVVVVTNNHRTNFFGFLNLAESGGEKYAGSANAGLLDMVAVLQWVRDHIANFGGDPNNVMIFGQSGGGEKVSALMAMPAAKGLFHRAVIQSGPMLRARNAADTARTAANLLAALDLRRDQLDRLQALPVETIVKALSSSGPGGMGGWGPTVDGKILPAHPFDPSAPAQSADVPLMIGTTLNEGVHGVDNPDADALTESDLRKRLSQRFGDKTEEIIAAYRREYPAVKPFDILSVASAAYTRQGSFTLADRKAAQGRAPVYQYVYAWHTPQFDGRPRAFHSSEITFAFDNGEFCENYSGLGSEALALSRNMGRCWASFARSGDPNHPGMPAWAAFTPEKHATMYLDVPCSVKVDPEAEGRRIISKIPRPGRG